jgi:hypothetical protein
MFKKLLLLFLFLSITNLLYSQITISSPVVRQIFQRDLNNQAIVTITGSYSQPIDTIQVRFTPVKAGQGTAIDWRVIKSMPLGGLFKGSVTVKGGWYIMDVRGLLNGKVVGNISTLERVGVGEVFVLAGQSNAGGSGLLEGNETAATDDRVNCANFISPRLYNPKGWEPFKFFQADLSQFSIVEFSQLKKTAAIGPTGLGPYYWGKVGDALSAKLNVPIMFFNAAWAGASVRVWRESAENPTTAVPSDFQFDNTNNNKYPVGYPYANLNAVLRYYGINMGMRAILWMEGETQNLLNLDAIAQGKTPPVTTENYLDNLRRLVKRSRQDLGTNKLAWVVAQTSYSAQLNCTNPKSLPPTPSPIIVKAQIEAISDPTLAPTYPGPFTDNIQVTKIGEREQCVHFTGTGLDQVAASWVKALLEDNKNFFETVEPIISDTIPSVSLECVSSGTLKLSLPSGYAGYEWVNVANSAVVGQSQSVNVGSGTYIARVTRSNGNIIQVPKFTVNANTPPSAPIVKALSDVNFCLGTSVALQSSTDTDNPIYEWSISPNVAKLPRTKDIVATLEGSYRLRVIDKNACASAYSTEVKLVAKPRPAQPFISTSGTTELCQGQALVLTSSNIGASSYLWKRNREALSENTQVITVQNPGVYSVQARATNGCLSDTSANNISVVVNSLPLSPQIRAVSDTVFCDGGSVSLVLSPKDNSSRFGWNRNNSVNNADNTTTIKVSNTELVRGFVVNTKGCLSLLSNAIQVVKKDNPKILSIVPKSTYSFVARSSSKIDEYVWKYDGKNISIKDSIIRTFDKGAYTVIGKSIYKVKSTTTPLTCSSLESEKFDFNPYDDKGLSVYPNPSSGVFVLEGRYDLEKVVVSVWSLDGKALFKSDVIDTFNAQSRIDVSSLSEGIYILKIESPTFKLTKQISIVR